MEWPKISSGGRPGRRTAELRSAALCATCCSSVYSCARPMRSESDSGTSLCPRIRLRGLQLRFLTVRCERHSSSQSAQAHPHGPEMPFPFMHLLAFQKALERHSALAGATDSCWSSSVLQEPTLLLAASLIQINPQACLHGLTGITLEGAHAKPWRVCPT